VTIYFLHNPDLILKLYLLHTFKGVISITTGKNGSIFRKGNGNDKEIVSNFLIIHGGRRGSDRMVVGFTTTCPISAYHH
jgi:hypothetical protein